MPDFPVIFGTASDPMPTIAARLVVAMVFGAAVAFLHRATRRVPSTPFTTTLVLLAVLIAMVTQVIGDNVARAFSLVGALSIVRFRTVVRDTQDTAYVIASVAVGMAVGAGHLFVAGAGFVALAISAAALMPRGGEQTQAAGFAFALTTRIGLGVDAPSVVVPVLRQHAAAWRLVRVATAKQGLSLDVSYRLDLKAPERAQELVGALTLVEGVQSVDLALAGPEQEG